MNKHLDDPWVHPELDEELRALYSKLGFEKTFKAGDYLHHCEDLAKYAYLVVEGACRYEYTTEKGLIRTLGTIYPNSSCCEYPNIIHTSVELDIKAIEDTVTIAVPYSRLDIEIHNSPVLSRKFLKYLCDKKNCFLEIYHHFTESNTFVRFMVYLRSMVSYYNVQIDSDGFYTLPLTETHERIGEVISCTRVTFSRMYKYMVDNGYIIIPEKGYVKFNVNLLDEEYITEEFNKVSWKDMNKK